MTRALPLSLLFTFLIACGPPVPGTGGTQKPGEGCAQDSECESGLECVEGECVFRRCNRAPDPEQFCALELGVERERAVCDSGTGECTQLKGSLGDTCGADEACTFGSICEGGVCIETCVSSASCRIEGEVCLEREGAPERFCQPSPGCQAFPDPRAHCGDMFGVPESQVDCDLETGMCLVIERRVGVSCRFDAQCVEGAVCEGMICTPLCEEDDECGALKVCKPRLGEGDARICEFESCAYAEDPDLFCTQELASEDAYCDFDGMCVRDISLTGQVVLLSDVNIGEACSEDVFGGPSPGFDLTYMLLYDYENELPIAVGEIVAFDPGVGPNGNAFEESTFRGVTSGFEVVDIDTGCRLDQEPSATPDIRSLGCGGSIAVEFRSVNEGARVILTDEHIMVFGEHGPTCDERAMISDEATLSLCRDPDALRTSGDTSSCDVPLAIDAFGGALVGYLYDEGF